MVQFWRHLRLWDVVGKYDRVQLLVGMHVYEELRTQAVGGEGDKGGGDEDGLSERASEGLRSGRREGK